MFEPKPSRALSYIIGANIGDGCSLTKSGCVKLEVVDLDFAETFNRSMAVLFSRVRPNVILRRIFTSGRLPLYIVKYTSRQLVKLLRLPLRDLLKLAFAYPREFLRGFFDAEGHVDVSAVRRFQLSVGAENSNKFLLRRVRELLRIAFGMRSFIDSKRKAGSTKVIRGRTFVMRRASFSLVICRWSDECKFAEGVGFSILRKEQKLVDALQIVASEPPSNRSSAWKVLYTKERGEWVRRPSVSLG